MKILSLYVSWGLLALLMCPPPVSAQQADSVYESMSDVELEQRLQFLENRLAEQQPRAKTWQYGWTGGYAVATVAQAVQAFDEDDNDNDEQLDYALSAAKTAGGLAQMLIKPTPAVRSSERFGAMPSNTRQQRLGKLKEGEALLRGNADRAATRRSWRRHMIGIGANLVTGGIIAIWGDGSDAVTSTVVGIAVAQANIWSEPARAIDDLEDYQRNRWSTRKAAAIQWSITPTTNGVTVSARF